jgi:hypothetical protein
METSQTLSERSEARWARLSNMPTTSECREAVMIEVFQKQAPFACRKITGKIEESDNTKLVLLIADEIEPSTSISVRSKNLLFKGNVTKCVPHVVAGWEIQIRLSRTLLVV